MTPARPLRACLLLVVVLAVAACGQSEDDLRRYAADLERQPGVADVSVSVSTPLPLSVQGTVDVQLEPDVTRAQFDDFAQRACDTEVNATVDLDLTIDVAPKTELRQEHVAPCSKLPPRLVEFAAALAGQVDGVERVAWEERAVRDSDDRAASLQLSGSGLAGTPTTRGVTRIVAITETVLDTLGDDAPKTFDLRAAPAVTISSASVARARQVLEVTRTLVDAGYFVTKVDAPRGGVLIQLDSGDVAAAQERARSTVPDLDGVRVIGDAVTLQGSGVDDDAVDLATALQAGGPGWGVTASSRGVNVELTDTADVLRAYEAARDADLADVRISYAITPSPGVSVSMKPSVVELTRPALRARVAVVDELLAPELHVRTVRFERGGVQAWLDEEHYDDADSVEVLRGALRDALDRHGLDGLDFVKVNNRDVR